MNIYLDIDGVLLKKHGGPADNVLDFLKYVTENHDCYWLTTHCRNGSNQSVEYLEDKLPSEALEYLNKIKPAYWDVLKTEGIDFSKDFRWYDDYIMEAEEKVLKDNNCLDKFIKVENSELLYCFTKEEIYKTITSKMIESVEKVIGEITFEALNENEKEKEDKLIEISKYVYVGSALAFNMGLGEQKHEIMNYIIDQKIEEYNDEKLKVIVNSPNIKFQLSNYMSLASKNYAKYPSYNNN